MGDKKRILIVEDEVQLAFILKQSLEFNDFLVDMAHNVNDGIKMLETNQYHCVVSDYFLPQQSGEELFKFVTEHDIVLPFIFMTGSPSLDFAVNFLKQGGAEYISKPFNLNDFVEKVREVIAKFEERQSQEQYFDSLQQKLDDRVKEITIYQDIFHSSGDGIFIMGMNMVIVKCNPALLNITGFNNREVLAHFNDIFKPLDKDSEKLSEGLNLLESNGAWHDEIEFLTRDKQIYQSLISLSKVNDENGNTFAFMGSIKDVTKIKQMEKNLLISLQRTTTAQEAIIFGLAKLAESRDPDTGGHLERIRSYCQLIANQLKDGGYFSDVIDETFINALYITAPLHDIGKVGIPDSVLLKRGDLSAEEFELMKQHTVIGAETLQAIANEFGGIEYLKIGIEIAIAHHERWDGEGYPFSLKGKEIPLAARILAIADVYDALTTERVYKKALSHNESIEMMMGDSNSHFDPVLLEVFHKAEKESLKIMQSFS